MQQSLGQKESAEDRIRSRITEADTGASEAEYETFDRERILKKTVVLGFFGKAKEILFFHSLSRYSELNHT